jgi:hypothetical protein
MADYTGSFSGSFEGTFLGGVVSSSAQLSINWNSAVITNKPTTISPFQANSIIANNRFRESTFPAHSASVSTRFTNINSEIGVLDDRITAAVSGTVPPGTISGSGQIAAFGYLTSASAAALGFGSGGGASIPAGTISSSTQITNVITDAYISASAAASGFGSGGGEIYTAGLGILVSGNVISLDTASQHFIQGVSASAAASGFGGGGGSNAAPTIEDQTLTTVNESSGSTGGFSVGSITATDAEGNVITFSSFTISNVFLSTNPSVNLTSSLGGTSPYDPSQNPFQANSSGLVTIKNGQFLNADVADRYVYLATATDPFATTSGSGFVTIPISQHTSSSIGVNGGTYYIIESGVTGDNLTTNSNGRTTGDITFTSAVSQRWVVNSNPSGYIRFVGGLTAATGASTPVLELAQNISGSGLIFDLGSTIDIQITASDNSFESTKQYRNHTLNIAKNFAPSGSMVRTDANLNTNGARSGNTIATLTWTDTESNSLHNPSFTLSSNAGLSSSFTSSYTYNIFPTGSLSAGTYYVSASVKDIHGFRVGSSSMSFTIAQANSGSITSSLAYVIESAVSGAAIFTNTNGRTGTTSSISIAFNPNYNSQVVASYTSSNPLIQVKSFTNNVARLTISGSGVSGSGYLNSGSISSSISYVDQYGNVGSGWVYVTVTKNYAPDITFTNQPSTVLNTNIARSASNPTLCAITFNDRESDALNHNTFTFTNPSGQLSASRVGDTWEVKPITNLSASVYQMTASIKDIHGFNTAIKTNTFEIIQASIGSFSQPSLFIVESALSGAGVTTESDGSGSAYTLSISYGPNYGVQVATNFSASGDGGYVYVHPTSGSVTIYKDLSGSAVQNGSSLTPLITWNDQYGNLGSQSLSVGVVDNQPATAIFTDLTANWVGNPVSSGVGLVSASISDPEVQIVSMSLSGPDAGSLVAVPQNFDSSSYVIKSATTLTPATYLYSASIHDNYGNTTSHNRSIVVTAPVSNPQLYIYLADHGSDGALGGVNYLAVMGASTVNGNTPPQVTTLTATSGSFFKQLIEGGKLGSTGLILPGAKVGNLVATATATGSVEDIVENIGQFATDRTGQLIVIFPSGSDDLTGLPTSMTDEFAGSVLNQYVLQIQANAGGWANTIVASTVNEIVLNSAVDGYTNWFVIGRNGYDSVTSNAEIRIIPASGSSQS